MGQWVVQEVRSEIIGEGESKQWVGGEIRIDTGDRRWENRWCRRWNK